MIRQYDARRLAEVCWGRPSSDAPLTAATCGREPPLETPKLFGRLGTDEGPDDNIYSAGEFGVLFAMLSSRIFVVVATNARLPRASQLSDEKPAWLCIITMHISKSRV